MPGRALFSSFLLAVVLLTGATAAQAAPKKHRHAAKAKVALAKKKRAKAKTATKPVSVKPAAPQPVVAPPAPAACANTDLVPDAGNLDLIRAAIVCLHNQTRAGAGLGTLAENGALATAGLGHSDDMVDRGYFDHFTPEGGAFDERILAAGYAGANDGWTLGENLAWGTGELSTPAGLMRSWMNSPGHRANILKGAYREIGIGLRLGTPTGSIEGLTVSVEFGARDL